MTPSATPATNENARQTAAPPRDISVLIPTWNGRRLLEENLPAVVGEAEEYRRQSGAAAEIVVVDDGGGDDSMAWLAGWSGRGVRAVRREANGGFAAACNTGFRETQHPVVVLLNNDVRPAPGFLFPLLCHFAESDIFGVTCRALQPGTRISSTSGKLGSFRHGFWSGVFNYEPRSLDSPGPWPSFTAIGGFAALDRRKVLELGGFLEIYNPFYWEDTDLSYRAWARGWRVLYEPRSEVFHQPSQTIGRAFRRRTTEVTSIRNRLLFHWINLHDGRMLAAHAGVALLVTLSRWAGSRREYYPALREALRRLPEARRLRREAARGRVRSDREIARLFRELARRDDIRILRSHADAAALAGQDG